MEGTWVTNNCDKLLHKSLNHFGFRLYNTKFRPYFDISIETKPPNTLLGLSIPAMSYGVDAEVDISVVFISSGAESQSQ